VFLRAESYVPFDRLRADALQAQGTYTTGSGEARWH